MLVLNCGELHAQQEDISASHWYKRAHAILWKTTWHHLKGHRLALLGGALVVGLLFVALAAPLLVPYDPIEQNLYQRLEPPSMAHPLGTDDFGRDILSRIIYGSRISLRIGLISISIALTAGTFLGLVAGYWGGLTDNLIMRLVDIALAFPSILLAIGIVAVIGPGIDNVMLAVSIVMVPQYARLVRASVLSIREMAYVEAARSLGASDWRILFTSILPNCAAPLIVQSTLSLGTAILDAAGLSFLGLGAQPPTPEWGAMLSGGRELLLKAPWVMSFPGLAIFVVVLALNLLGDGLRDALDPKRVTAR
ncbi:MAG: ABC transporter permease subunit [Candidatus Latescibacteria bacterium]|nr:ABC transporter permease subunit [Candidatus Latescibacterota bacterium]